MKKMFALLFQEYGLNLVDVLLIMLQGPEEKLSALQFIGVQTAAYLVP